MKSAAVWLLLLLLAWGGIAASQVVSPAVLPAPWSVLAGLLDLPTVLLLGKDAIASLRRLGIGFGIAGAVGVPLGLYVGLSESRYRWFAFPTDFSRSIPVAALLPLFFMVFGFGELTRYLATAWSAGLVLFVNSAFGARSIRRPHLRLIKYLKAGPMTTMVRLVIPSALPLVLAGIRVGISIALIVVVMTEMLFTSAEGLGARIYNAALLYQTDHLYLYILATGLLGYIVNHIMERLETKVVHWRGKA